MAGRFVPTVDSTRDDEDNNSRVSDILLQRPTHANVSSDNSALVTFSQVEIDLDAECSKSPSDTESDQGRSLANKVSKYILPRVHRQFLDHMKLFNLSHNEHEKL